MSTTSKTLEPFAIRWVGENYNAPWPIALYGLTLFFAGVAYFILTKALIAHHGASSRLATSIGRRRDWWCVLHPSVHEPLNVAEKILPYRLCREWLVIDQRLSPNTAC